ncbi:SDR family NAD(P)-dependent oxidoreductase [Virgisporangium aurantiacum]|uniref:Beta-ketoacyl-ACP reductase n=1 Tax=Virgisporangium aurantiacum TaxID=175570 RepID=A0A8J3Z698_9ACTN|nr:SDR family oxidoreductase [Virgisporangium aurantiacum]GIJ55748.1 beta-ketoacyl-ACP reductase [Virgisporangium aurantiacum]
MDLGLEGRTVIVTGASGGIGRHIARRFAAEGADVVLTYHSSAENARGAAEKLAADHGTKAMAARFDLGDAASAPALVEAVLAWSGRIDVLVNNAVRWGATAPDTTGSFEDAPDEAWQAVVRDNVEGALRLSRSVAPHLRRRRWGRLVHVSSSIATEGMTGGEYYGAAKAALHGFSRSAAFSLGRDGDILSNVVIPGLTRTETNTHIVDSVPPEYAQRHPIGRLLHGDEVAAAIVYLGSAANTGINGQAILVNGG